MKAHNMNNISLLRRPNQNLQVQTCFKGVLIGTGEKRPTQQQNILFDSIVDFIVR